MMIPGHVSLHPLNTEYWRNMVMKKIKNLVVKALRLIRRKEEPDNAAPEFYDYLTSYFQELEYSMKIAKLLDDAKLENVNIKRVLAVTIAAVQMNEGLTEVEILNEKDLMMMELKEEV